MKLIALIAAILTSLTTPAFADWSAESLAIAERDRPKVLARFGGALEQGDLTAYVNEIGQRMASFSTRPDEDWHFTVLNSPQVNAFALPAGHVFITRGMLALANNEAQIAAILAHEIVHVTEEHIEARNEAQKDALIDGALGALVQGVLGGDDMGNAIRDNITSAIGAIGQFSQEQEFSADRGGILMLAEAGYAPIAQADFLTMMMQNSALQASLAGREFDGAQGSMFAIHPAPDERQTVARDLAGDMAGATNREPYLAAIDGLQFGENVQNGSVDGNLYTDVAKGFSFVVADGWRVQDAEQQVNIIGQNGATLILSTVTDRGGRLTDYIGGWVNALPNRNRIGRRVSRMQPIDNIDQPSATATLRYRARARSGELRLAVIRYDGLLIRFAGFSRDRDDNAEDSIVDMIESFSSDTSAQNGPAPRFEISIHRVVDGDTIESLTSMAPQLENAEAIFRVLNGLDADTQLENGALVKTIVEVPQ